MRKVILFGAGAMCKHHLNTLHDDEILAICDNNSQLWGGGILAHKIISPDKILDYDFDRIVITIKTYLKTLDEQRKAKEAVFDIIEQLKNMGVDQRKVELSSALYSAPISLTFEKAHANWWARSEFLRYFASHNRVDGDVAECGVFAGDFAALINLYYPDRKLYLMDTFEGFDEQDIDDSIEIEERWWKGVNNANSYREFFSDSETLALFKCRYRDNVEVLKGFVPDTLQGLENNRFAFVSLDMDVYKPMRAAIEFFVPRINKGGVILCHDYINPLFGTKQAVDELQAKLGFITFPIGDNCSVAIMPC